MSFAFDDSLKHTASMNILKANIHFHLGKSIVQNYVQIEQKY